MSALSASSPPPPSSGSSPSPAPPQASVSSIASALGGVSLNPHHGWVHPGHQQQPQQQQHQQPQPGAPAAWDTGRWRFQQSFGDDNSSEDDLITAVEFDPSGDFLAVGDKAGRICVFELHETRQKRQRAALHPRERWALRASGRWNSLGGASTQTPAATPEYKFYTEFQSHESEFDCLKSLEIDEKINQIRWFPHKHSPLNLISTNDKTIKFWKIYDQRLKRPLNARRRGFVGGGDEDDQEAEEQSKSSTAASSSSGNYDRDPSNATDLDNGFLELEDYDPSGQRPRAGGRRHRRPQSELGSPDQASFDTEDGEDDEDPLDPEDPWEQQVDGLVDAQEIQVPKLSHYQTITKAVPKRIFSNGHAFHIHSVSLNCDGETFLSSDDLRINLWNVEITGECFNIVDTKPGNLDDLTEVITTASFHPRHCNILLYSTSRGSVRLADLRDSALCDTHVKTLEMDEDPASKNFFSEIISSVSDAKFTPDGRYVLTRDYMAMKVWDVNMENRPVAVIPVHDFLTPNLIDLYENECMFDKFDCASSHDGTKFVSGSYSNRLTVHDSVTRRTRTFQPLRSAPQPENAAEQVGRPASSTHSLVMLTKPPHFREVDFARKALHLSWHPRDDRIAVAGLNKLYIYSVF